MANWLCVFVVAAIAVALEDVDVAAVWNVLSTSFATVAELVEKSAWLIAALPKLYYQWTSLNNTLLSLQPRLANVIYILKRFVRFSSFKTKQLVCFKEAPFVFSINCRKNLLIFIGNSCFRFHALTYSKFL